MKVVVFDVDNTFLKCDSLLIAAKLANNPIQLFIGILKIIPFYFLWKTRFLEVKAFKEKFLCIFKICEKFNSKGFEQIYLEILIKNIDPKALLRFKFHKERCHKIILCSASPRMLLEKFANFLQVDLVCTELSKVQNNWKPIIIGKNCNNFEKVLRIREFIKISYENCKLEVYGDSKGDKELLDIADIPHYRDFSSESVSYKENNKLMTLTPVFAIAFLAYIVLIIFTQGYEIFPYFLKLWKTIITGLFFVLISYFLRFFRWRMLLSNFNYYPPIFKDLSIWISSLAFTATPAKGGESIRCLLLKKEFNFSRSKTLYALFIERITDLIAVLIIILININLVLQWKNEFAKNTNFQPNLVLIFFIIFIFICVFLKKTLFGFIKKNNFQYIKLLLSPLCLFQAILLALIAWSLEGLSFFLLLRDIGVNITSGGAILAHTAGGLLGALSLIPGGLGVAELSTIGLLKIQNVPLLIGGPLTIIIRFMTLWFGTLLGIVFLLFNINQNHSKIE